ncbi:Metallo-hydrolase/oxidoreductase [Corynespora cassiicola Philippines]|uniref:Metallo-hydrolase/oxidoreductase n=1 Tax=Corynespora cassiicola Philippines TaxID=1448308 RepID=A0A2T2PCW6_CORCC|nr:Metallo-hydrolase/oxidoreductase [Corynespora cassiicola Philippines]
MKFSPLALAAVPASASCLRVETFINGGASLDMVSSLVIGSEAAVLIDMPLAVPQAQALAAWVANTTDKPLIAAFTTHFHPDHYLSGAALFAHFPDTKYYASSKSVAHIENEAATQIEAWGGILGADNVPSTPVLPSPYDFTFFTLPGDEDAPIHLLSPLVGDTVDETMFWIPSVETLIAGDTVFSQDMHLWLSDLVNVELTESWISTLDYIDHLHPRRVIPGHAAAAQSFRNATSVQHSRDYLNFFKDEVQNKGVDAFTPQELYAMFNEQFPGILSENSAMILNISSENFGKGGAKREHYFDLEAYNSTAELQGWNLGA